MKHKIILLVLIILFCFSGYKLIDYYIETNKTNEVYNDIYNEFLINTTIELSNTISTTQETTIQETSITETTISETSENVENNRLTLKSRPERLDIEKREKIIANNNLPNIDIIALKNKYPDVIGWLYGQGGIVNYPVAQGLDNDYYTHHLLDGTEKFEGTLMVDADNKEDDEIIFIYGHAMKNGTMFGQMKKYDTYDYYQKYPYFYLLTEDAIYRLDIIWVVYTVLYDGYDREFSITDNLIEFYNRKSQYNTGIEVQKGDKLITLSSCAYYTENGRYRVICKLIKL